MFGAFRTFLALLVVFNHLAGAHLIGRHAVFGFYILSGYLMTLIMHKNYGYSLAGMGRYFANRALRIYPIYWLACLLSLLLIYLLGVHYTTGFDPGLYVPRNLHSILRNVFLYLFNQSRPKLVPPSWALTVELFFYICIGLGLSRNRYVTAVWFVGSLAFAVIANLQGLSWEYRYFYISGASLPFSTGALIYHYRYQLTEMHRRYLGWRGMPLVYAALIIANWALSLLAAAAFELTFYINYVVSAMMLIALMDRVPTRPWEKKLDKVLGDFSYPIYLIHYQVGIAVAAIFAQLGWVLERPSLTLALASLPAIFAVAWGLTLLVERPMEKLRSRVKVRQDEPAVGRDRGPKGSGDAAS